MTTDAEPTTLEDEIRKERSTMSLYVSIVLLAALMAVPDSGGHGHAEVLGIVWGSTIGLTLAHLFAFRVSARLVSEGRIPSRDARIAGAQLVGSVVVAILVTIPVAALPRSAELDVARVVLAVYVALVGYRVASTSGGTRSRSLAYAAIVLVGALGIAVVKNVLGGH